MKRLLLAGFIAATAVAAAPVHAQTEADPYADAAARELVARARVRRAQTDMSITEYRARTRDRFSVSHRVIGRERLIMRREMAARVHWRREGEIDFEVLGAREGFPAAGERKSVPDNIRDHLHFAFDPLDSEFLFRFDTMFARHPLAAEAERDYRYATGDSSVLRLPDGTAVHLRELRVTPRRADPRLIVGSFWIDNRTHAVVQAVFRPASAYGISIRPGVVTMGPMERNGVSDIGGEITQVAVDYGLWDLQWWLPRYVVMDGVAQLGSLGNVAVKYEMKYDDYEVVADTTRVGLPMDTLTMRCRTAGVQQEIVVLSGPDSTRASWERNRSSGAPRDSTAPPRCIRHYRVSAPATTDSLLASEHLPGSMFEADLLSKVEQEQLEALLKRLPIPDWHVERPTFQLGLGLNGLLRFNRVEGLAVGARTQMQLGRADALLEARYGFADEWPKALARVRSNVGAHQWTVSGYRDLRAVDADTKPFSMMSSLTALFIGREDALLYRASGASFALNPPRAQPQWYALRLYAERQSAARKNTDFSLPNLVDDSRHFGENITADRARQYGAELTLRNDMGVDPHTFRLGAELDVRAETGAYRFLRPALTVRMAPPVLGVVATGVEVAAGTTFGASPAQSLTYLGGSSTLRGYATGTAGGAAFWRARAEIGSAFPAARITLFSDVGWAGSASAGAWRSDRPLLSAGAGFSTLDGLVRVDLARAVRAPTGWRLHLYLNGIL